MIFGIDLGTTYSLIGSGEELYTNLVASAVDLETKQQVDINTVSNSVVKSYKVDMTTGSTGLQPIACSSIVLRKLADDATRRSGVEVKDVVISVPAKFTSTQRDATWKAAEKAGLNPRALLNEPTAAALYACKDYKDLIVVYDLGGGTFDVTILDARCGYYFVIATDGNAHLAGDNLDRAIAELAMKFCKVKIKDRSKTNLQNLYNKCRIAKEHITSGSDVEFIELPEMGVMFKLDKDTYIETMKRVFQPTIDLTKNVISSNLMEMDRPKLLFVGGSTNDKYLREWVDEELGLEHFEIDCDPSFIVAKGIARYAEMVGNGQEQVELNDVTCRLAVGMYNGLTETVIPANSQIPTSDTFIGNNSEETDRLIINLYQGDDLTEKAENYIGTLEYNYGRIVKANEGIVEIKVSVDRNGMISLQATDFTTNDVQEVKLVMR